MKIALAHDFLVKLGGAERVLKVLTEMFPEAPIYTLLYDEKKVGKVFPKEKVISSGLQRWPRFIRRRQRYLLPYMPREIEKFDLSKFDLVISSNSAFAHGIVPALDTYHLCYCHSPMRYAWDWYHQYIGEQKVGPLRRLAIRYLLNKIRIWDRVAADRVDKFLANSVNVKKRIQKYYRKESELIYPPVDIDRFKVTTKHEDYFLIVSTLTPYKQIDLAVKLFNKIGRKLVIIGAGSARKDLEKMADDNIDFLGYKSDSTVKEYLQNCRALIFPGEEDFGIVPVEAMACGKPVLALAKGGALETIKPGVTGEFFYTDMLDSMEDGLARLLLNEKKYRPTLIRQQAEKFSRKKFELAIKREVKAVKQKASAKAL